MLVEDEWAIAADLQRCLEKLDYEVTSIAESGADAIAQAKENMPDLILMDISLKGKMTGIEAAGTIRSTLGIPHVFLTAFSGNKELEHAKVTEPMGYLIKPFDEGSLKASVEMALYKGLMEKKLRHSEKMLQESHDRLEMKITERTAALARMNEALSEEILERKQISEELKEKNSALKVLLQQRSEDKKELEQVITSNIKCLVLPYISKLKRNQPPSEDLTYINIIESNLEDITSSFSSRLSYKYLDFTPTEILIADLIKDGLRDKEIMEVLNISQDTVKAHRKNIRRKLKITNEKINLRTKLLSLN